MPPAAMLDETDVFQDDGSMAVRTRVWSKEGEAGVHRFERYRDKRVRTEETEDDGTCILRADQQEKKAAAVFSAINVKEFSLDGIAAIPMDDAEDEPEPDGDVSDADSSDVSDAKADALEGREHRS